MSADRRSWLSRSRRRVEADPELVLVEMEAATQRLRDQAWKINATTRARLIPEEEARTDATAEVGPPPARQGPPAAS